MKIIQSCSLAVKSWKFAIWFYPVIEVKNIFSLLQVWVPGYFIYYLLTTPGSLVERLKLGITPVIQPRADAVIAIEKQKMEQAQKTADLDVEMRLVADSSSTTDIVKSNHH